MRGRCSEPSDAIVMSQDGALALMVNIFPLAGEAQSKDVNVP